MVEHDLILQLGDGGAFDGSRMGNQRVEIEFVIVYLIVYAQFPILGEKFF
jgi:hypothetical protein